MTTSAIHPVAIKIDLDIKERLKKLAEVRNRTPHWLMREAISQYVEREEQRESMKQDAMNSWRDFQETGLHATGEEVIAWLETWGDDNELSAPVCHK